jgi:hypothetical protein
MITLPFTADPCRTFTIALNEVLYQFTTRWNERAARWTCDIEDVETGIFLARTIPLVLGADLLQSFCPRLGRLIVIDLAAEPGAGTEAGVDDLGSRVQVIWLAPGEVPT